MLFILKCSYEKRGIIFRKTTEDFIKKAKEVHGDKYDYSKTEYINIVRQFKSMIKELRIF